MMQLKQCCFLVLLLGSLYTAYGDSTILFEEGFSELTSIPSQWYIHSGKWEIKDDSLWVDTLEGEAFLFFGENNWKNYIIEADVTFHQVRNKSRWASVVFRADRNGQMPWSQCPVRFESSARNGVEFAVKKENHWAVRQEFSASKDSKSGIARKLKVVVKDTQIVAFLDGIPVIRSYLCVERSNGCVGLGASGCIASFDNLRISSLNTTDKPSAKSNSYESTLWIAHRGYSAIAPENTLSALAEAINHMADGVEFDLWTTQDNVPVLLHDLTVQRTTNGQGMINTFTLEEVKKLDAGSWKNERYRKERIPTLDEALGLLENSYQKIIIEIKDNDVTPLVLNQIDARSLFNRAYIFSSDKHLLSKINSQNSAYQTVLLCRLVPSHTSAESEKVKWLMAEAAQAQTKILSIKYLLLSPDIIEYLHHKNIQVWAWTVNDPDVAATLLKWGIDAIITDRIELKEPIQKAAWVN